MTYGIAMLKLKTWINPIDKKYRKPPKGGFFYAVALGKKLNLPSLFGEGEPATLNNVWVYPEELGEFSNFPGNYPQLVDILRFDGPDRVVLLLDFLVCEYLLVVLVCSELILEPGNHNA